MLDAQVQIKLIEIAKDWVDKSGFQDPGTAEARIDAKAKLFDSAYKAITKTVETPQKGGRVI